MTVVLRDVRETDLEAIQELNNRAGTTILPLDKTQTQWFFDHAHYFRVAELENIFAGFLIGVQHDASYGSPNFQWFRQQFKQFVYIDRIVVDDRYRGVGLGRLFYADIQSYAEVRVPLLTCEVFLEPRDDISLLFHGTFGFREVGQQTILNGQRRVSLLAKELPSYSYVQNTYVNGLSQQLPDLPWLKGRVLSTFHRLETRHSVHSSHAASESIF